MSEFHQVHQHAAGDVDGGGGGGSPAWDQSGSGSPVGTITPNQKGARYQDLANGALYVAVGATNADWVSLGGRNPTQDNTVGVGTVGGTGFFAVQGPGGKLFYIGDAVAQDGTGNGLYWDARGADGTQVLNVQLGPADEWLWRFQADGGLKLPNGNSLYNTATATPSNTIGANGDWTLGADGHIGFKAAGTWGVKV